MTTENRILLQKSREALKNKWGLAIGTFLIYLLMTGSAGAIGKMGPVLSLIIAGPLALGAAHFSLAVSRGKEASLELIFYGFNRFTTALSTYLLMLIIVALWSILLIIPGIIAALSYSMAFYIISDEPSFNARDVLKESKKLMNGHKWKLFNLCLYFFLLALLCILTLGIGFLWLVPYIQVTMATFYDDLKAQANHHYDP